MFSAFLCVAMQLASEMRPWIDAGREKLPARWSGGSALRSKDKFSSKFSSIQARFRNRTAASSGVSSPGAVRRHGASHRRGQRGNANKCESAGRLPEFNLSGVDVEQPGALARVVGQIAFNGEVILVCGDTSAYASPTALNTVLQLWALRLRHTLYISDSASSCARLRSALPSLACVWSSSIRTTKPAVKSECVRKYAPCTPHRTPASRPPLWSSLARFFSATRLRSDSSGASQRTRTRASINSARAPVHGVPASIHGVSALVHGAPRRFTAFLLPFTAPPLLFKEPRFRSAPTLFPGSGALGHAPPLPQPLRYWDMRFYFYHIRKRMVLRLAVEHSLNVLQTDTDVAWFANPYPALHTQYRAAHLLTQADAPFINAGVFYVRVKLSPGRLLFLFFVRLAGDALAGHFFFSACAYCY